MTNVRCAKKNKIKLHCSLNELCTGFNLNGEYENKKNKIIEHFHSSVCVCVSSIVFKLAGVIGNAGLNKLLDLSEGCNICLF